MVKRVSAEAISFKFWPKFKSGHDNCNYSRCFKLHCAYSNSLTRSFSHSSEQRHQLKAWVINYIDLVSLSVLTGAECWIAPFFKCCLSFLRWILRYVTQIRLRVFTPYIQRRTRKFHVVVMPRQRVNVPESVMHEQSCCFCFTKPIPLLTSHCRLLWRSLWRRCRGCLKGPCQGCEVHFVNNREMKHRVYGKREIQVEKFSKWEMSWQKQLKTIELAWIYRCSCSYNEQ